MEHFEIMQQIEFSPEGLHPGDVIVVDGIEKLVDGAQVAAGPSSPAQKDLTQKH